MDVKLVKNQDLIDATIKNDGTVFCHENRVTYPCPSLFRDAWLGSNKPTYRFILYKGVSLANQGVRP